MNLETVWEFELAALPGGSAITVGAVLTVLALLIAGYLLSRLVGLILVRRLSRTSMRRDAIEVVRRITYYLILLLVVMVALSLLQIPLTAFAFVTGAVAIGVGFGAQNIINNFISGWILMTERPIRIDDFVEFDNAFGTVERIGNRSTRIKRVDGVHVVVPNSHLLERTVVNWTLIDKNVRTFVRVGVAYDSDLSQVEELMLQAMTAQPEVLKEPPPVVVFDDFGDSALVFEASFWCESGGRELRLIRSDIRFRIAELFHRHNVVVAFPQQDVHLNVESALPVSIKDGAT